MGVVGVYLGCVVVYMFSCRCTCMFVRVCVHVCEYVSVCVDLFWGHVEFENIV